MRLPKYLARPGASAVRVGADEDGTAAIMATIAYLRERLRRSDGAGLEYGRNTSTGAFGCCRNGRAAAGASADSSAARS